MDLDIAERLICPELHTPNPATGPATSPLVVRADVVHDGRLSAGLLGCPVCLREWNVHAGVARFGARAALNATAMDDAALAAALLGLSEPMTVLADGIGARLARALAVACGARIIALDSDIDSNEVTVFDGVPRVPFARGAVQSALLLRTERSAAFVESVVEALGPGSRIVAVASIPLPGGAREIARDDQWWVAVCDPATAPVQLHRARD